MSTTKGRKTVKDNNGNSIFVNTVPKKSGLQGVLVKQDSIIDVINAKSDILTITSAAGAGGSATEAMTVTGLLTTDTILSVSQSVKGANSLPLLGFNTQAANALTGVWSANPGAGAIIIVTIARTPAQTAKVDLK